MTEETLEVFKGFDKDLKCRGFQYEVGKTYTHNGPVSLCSSGFHAVELPLDAMSYYPPIGSVYHRAALGGVTDEREKDSKRVGAQITVGAQINVFGLIEAHVEAIWDRAAKKPSEKKNATTGDSAHAATTGYSAHAATTGYSAHAATTGDYANAATTGRYAHAATTGDSAHAATTGYSAHAATTGYSAHAATTGDSAHAATTGYSAHAATTGYSAHAATTGYSAHAATTGDSAHAATTGRYAHAATTGYSAHAATTGYSAHAATTGYSAHAATTGDYANAATTGRYANAATTGYSATNEASTADEGSIAAVLGRGKAKGALGCWLVLTERDNKRNILGVQAVQVDGETVHPNVFYTLLDGKVTEA
ncbi:DUF7666 domain-containing protein [Microbacterium sp. No. 7]|uniref:DUF7666 domain-containing protein n=1 Tax=Microbacterium sp. No. 7 TaxID=1714373 RepID=UPI0006D0BBA0|nr:hypothetical protein [Microbacterium sp. No. 7]